MTRERCECHECTQARAREREAAQPVLPTHPSWPAYPSWPTYPAYPAAPGCGCGPGALCMNAACPRRIIMTRTADTGVSVQ